MQAQLSQLTEQSGIDWRNVKLGNIFEFESIKQAKSQKEIPTDNSGEGVPYVIQSMFNNMVARTVNKQWLIEHNEAPVSGNRIVLGVTLPAVSYQPREFGASQVITATADWLNEKNGIFIATAISKLMYQFSYGKKPGLQIYKDMEIKLPINPNGEIAFDYIEAFVQTLESERLATLESERLATLEAYLLATGLSDVQLTEKESQSLSAFDTTGGARIEQKVFKFSQLFDNIQQGARLTKADQVKGNIPYVMSGVTNTGVVDYISNPVRTFPKNSLTIDIFGNTFYRAYDYGAGDDTGIFWNDDNRFNKFQMLYLASVINKFLAGKYDYGHKLRSSRTYDFEIQLPVKSDGEIDFDFMSTLMSAMQKVAIKGVVDWSDTRIEATKEVIEK